ncbi:MAG: hypothetical protein J1F11_10455 [Oscillospiraceae bacterium]|nr:hypothetical protein [Oscillospiraceae bacterium]
MSKNNLAYDLTKYEDVSPEKAPERRIRRHHQRAEHVGSVPKMIVTISAAGLLLGAVIYGKVENAAIYSEIAAQTRYVDMLNSENVRMQSEIEEMTSLRSLESYAEDVLGMQKLDKSQVEYVSIANGSIVDIPENEENIFVKLKNSFSDFLEYIRG